VRVYCISVDQDRDTAKQEETGANPRTANGSFVIEMQSLVSKVAINSRANISGKDMSDGRREDGMGSVR
jgi:hypothetical protein